MSGDKTEKPNKPDKFESEYYDYKRIFGEKIKPEEKSDGVIADISDKKKSKEKKYIATFLAQSVVCLIIIGSIIITKYANPKTFVSVSSALNGLYENNITLSDLNRLIDEKILGSDALSAFFNMNGVSDYNETEEPEETTETTSEYVY